MLWRWTDPVDFVTVTSSASAAALIEQLRNHDIRARERRLSVVAHGGTPVVFRVMVRRRDLKEAVHLLQSGKLSCDDVPLMADWARDATRCVLVAADGSSEAMRLVCSECGYDMSSMPRVAACPECGGRGPRAEEPVNAPQRSAAFWALMVLLGVLCGLPVLIALSLFI